MYRSILLTDGQEWACNREGRGIFYRLSGGTWQQHTGTSQTPRFRSARSLSRYVHENYRDNMGEALPRMTKALGWEGEADRAAPRPTEQALLRLRAGYRARLAALAEAEGMSSAQLVEHWIDSGPPVEDGGAGVGSA
jgi:hypothetical protein